MSKKELIRRLQISCLGLDPIDPLRLLVDDVIEALREHAMREVQRLGQEIEQEPVAHPVIAGALFDFMGWLTSRKERIVLSSADNASPAADAIRDFANMRGLSLDDAKVQDWNTAPPQRTWVGLTDEEIAQGCKESWVTEQAWQSAVWWAEAKLKEKNT
jgi:hypothetical protein